MSVASQIFPVEEIDFDQMVDFTAQVLECVWVPSSVECRRQGCLNPCQKLWTVTLEWGSRLLSIENHVARLSLALSST
jgi:hypothetical protein